MSPAALLGLPQEGGTDPSLSPDGLLILFKTSLDNLQRQVHPVWHLEPD